MRYPRACRTNRLLRHGANQFRHILKQFRGVAGRRPRREMRQDNERDPTAAPWVVRNEPPSGGEWEIYAQHEGRAIWVASAYTPEDAALVMAAPEMLALLEEIRADIIDGLPSSHALPRIEIVLSRARTKPQVTP